MENKEHINIIISGIGGQGVFSITQILWNLCAKKKFKCQGATFKGGAQKAGSIHSEMRIFFGKNNEIDNFSNQIKKGTLDLIIGFEPWETLRYQDFFNSNTKAVINSITEPLFIERMMKKKLSDPIETLKKNLSNIIVNDFSSMAKEQFNDIRMLNYLMLVEAINAGYLPFEVEDAKIEFISIINPRTEILTQFNK